MPLSCSVASLAEAKDHHARKPSTVLRKAKLCRMRGL